ncbi:hypothetical protein BOX15_Mlig024697g2, partial [Macrostomum lignano]
NFPAVLSRAAPPMREPSYEQPDRPLQPGDEDDDIVMDAAAIAPRHQLGVASAASADRTRSAEKSSKKHEAAERKRNKKRLRRRAAAERQARVGPASDAPAGAYDRVDGAVPDAGSGLINEGSDLDPALILPVPNSPDPTTALPQLCAPPATALRRSPYATGDAVARILPYLETDPEKPRIAIPRNLCLPNPEARNHASKPSGSSPGSQPSARGLRSPSHGASKGRRHPVLLVRPVQLGGHHHPHCHGPLLPQVGDAGRDQQGRRELLHLDSQDGVLLQHCPVQRRACAPCCRRCHGDGVDICCYGHRAVLITNCYRIFQHCFFIQLIQGMHAYDTS